MRNLWRSATSRRSFGAHVVLTSGTNILLMLLGVLTGVLVARLLGPDGRGQLAAIQLWAGFFALIAMLGLPEALAYYAAKGPDQAGHYLVSTVVLSLITSFVFVLIGYWLMPVVLSAQSPQIISAARWYLLLLPLTALGGVPYHALRGRSDFLVWNSLRLLPGLGWLVVIGVAWLLDKRDAQFLAHGYLIALAGLFLPIALIVSKRIGGPYVVKFYTWRKLLRYGIPSVLGSVPQMFNLRLDQMLMAVFLPTKLLGLYVVAVSWSGIVAPLVNALGVALLPRIAGQANVTERTRVFAQGSRLAVLVAASTALAATVLTPVVIPLFFGNDFIDAIPAGIALVWAGGILGVNGVLEEGLRGLGVPRALLMAELGGLVMTVVALLVLLPPWNIMGAAIASIIGYGTVMLLLIFQARRITGCSVLDLLCPTRVEIIRIFQRVRSRFGITAVNQP